MSENATGPCHRVVKDKQRCEPGEKRFVIRQQLQDSVGKDQAVWLVRFPNSEIRPLKMHLEQSAFCRGKHIVRPVETGDCGTRKSPHKQLCTIAGSTTGIDTRLRIKTGYTRQQIGGRARPLAFELQVLEGT